MGVELKPFSLWHWRTLAILRSPLIESGDDIAYSDLELAVQVCALSPFDDFSRIIRPGAVASFVLLFRRYRWEPFFDASLSAWRRYFCYHVRGPITKQSLGGTGGGAGMIPVHPSEFLATGLVMMNFSEQSAWSMTPGLARWRLAAARAFNGQEQSIVSETDIELALASGYTHDQLGLDPEDIA